MPGDSTVPQHPLEGVLAGGPGSCVEIYNVEEARRQPWLADSGGSACLEKAFSRFTFSRRGGTTGGVCSVTGGRAGLYTLYEA